MHVHLISIEISIVGVAVSIVHSQSVLVLQDNDSVGHDAGPVESGLAIHEHVVTIAEMPVN